MKNLIILGMLSALLMTTSLKAQETLSFDEAVTVEDISTVETSSVSQELVPGFRVRAFATDQTEGNLDIKKHDISNGLPSNNGVLAKWNTTGGIHLSAKNHIADFPVMIDAIYAVLADGFLDIKQAGTYEFKVDFGKDRHEWYNIKPEYLAVYIAENLVFGAQKGDKTASLQLDPGQYPIRIEYYSASQSAPRSRIYSKDKYGLTELRGKNIQLEINHVQAQKGYQPISDFVKSFEVSQNDDIRKNIFSDIVYSVGLPLESTKDLYKNTRYNESPYLGTLRYAFDFNGQVPEKMNQMFILDENSYAMSFEKSTSENGVIPNIGDLNLVEYEFTYKAEEAGVHFIMPHIRTRLEDYPGKDFSDGTGFYENERIGSNFPNVCKYEIKSYEPSTSQTKSIMSGANGKGTVLKGGIGSDYIGKLIVTEPGDIKISGKIVCAFNFDLTFLAKAPSENRLRTFSGEDQRPRFPLFE